MGRALKGMAKAKRVFTVDDDEYDDGTSANVQHSDGGGSPSDDDDNDHHANYNRGPSALRIRASRFDDTDPTYEGKVVKRADLRDDGDNDEDDEDAVERNMEEEWSEGEPFAASDDEDAEESGTESDNAPLDEVVEEDSDEDHPRSVSRGPLDDNDDVDDVIRNLEDEDDAAILMRGADAGQHDRAKHVYHQKLIYERCLELQISIKQILTAVHDVSSNNDNPNTTAALAASIRTSMASLSVMQQQLYTLPDMAATTTTSRPSTKKRAFDDTVQNCWAAIDAESTAALGVYEPILNKQSVQADTQGKKFKAVNQDILVQVDAVLADAQRVRRKAHPVVTDDDDANSTDHDDILDETTYDDKDFYHHLLKEYIESGTTVDDAAAAAAAQLKLKRKVNKKINRKASKGRVIKYTVLPKLQHFMFPDPSAFRRTDINVDELFRSLFTSSAASTLDA
ncbi:hypothetical protein H257_13701 [Aphanomyces astaci]|uniref:Apoptosis-antagonizing transcription factor C-terminal domain-containing protein n=2 Tax=Aphanomyces astaci TaxID=112090 RepID=W4FWC7_APHAT|nr:hypothetical protein H257_13701 [Aphanomyces astaci]ETV70968.1 hypothetical protein H257_13701 [Aphanomyces astaci]RQM28494.1 hypothetical protein B5M09_004954 [Aphanomyces astaci]|eukprot:XP_009839631.1 hypothetical protein H257_13701 [Aphanomyces astaci]